MLTAISTHKEDREPAPRQAGAEAGQQLEPRRTRAAATRRRRVEDTGRVHLLHEHLPF